MLRMIMIANVNVVIAAGKECNVGFLFVGWLFIVINFPTIILPENYMHFALFNTESVSHIQ